MIINLIKIMKNKNYKKSKKTREIDFYLFIVSNN